MTREHDETVASFERASRDIEIDRLRALNADMLAALRLLLDACPDPVFHAQHKLSAAQVPQLNGAIIMARAAIAKATQ